MAAPEDELYDLPAAEFVAARDELAKRLRADGDKDEAARVKKLRRPSVAAAAVNHAIRGHGKARDELLAAGKALRGAQEKLSGRDGRAKLRAAAERERTAVSALAEVAEASVDEPSAALSEKVRQTLHAAALDEEAREEIAAGRVTREHEAVAGFGFGGLAPEDDDEPRESQEDSARSAGKAARDTKKAAKKADAKARREREREAEHEREFEEAEDALAQAREAADQAEQEHADAEAALEEVREALDEATTAERAARKAKRELARAATRRERELEKLR